MCCEKQVCIEKILVHRRYCYIEEDGKQQVCKSRGITRVLASFTGKAIPSVEMRLF